MNHIFWRRGSSDLFSSYVPHTSRNTLTLTHHAHFTPRNQCTTQRGTRLAVGSAYEVPISTPDSRTPVAACDLESLSFPVDAKSVFSLPASWFPFVCRQTTIGRTWSSPGGRSSVRDINKVFVDPLAVRGKAEEWEVGKMPEKKKQPFLGRFFCPVCSFVSESSLWDIPVKR